MGFKIDRSKAEKRENIEAGWYEVTVINATPSVAKSGNKLIAVDYEIRSDVPQGAQGMKIRFDNFTLTENAEWKIQQFFEAVNFPDGMDFEDEMDAMKTAVGRALRVEVNLEEYNGYKNAKVKNYELSNLGTPVADGPPIFVGEKELPF